MFPEEYAKKTGALEKQIIESGKAGETEETLWLGGQEMIVQIVRVPLKDEEGQPAGILGVLWEVTEKKRAEEEAKKYRTHLEELVFARTSELERVSTQLQGETAFRRRIEEESRSAAEEWNRLRASLEGQVAERLAEIQRAGEQFQQESSLASPGGRRVAADAGGMAAGSNGFGGAAFRAGQRTAGPSGKAPAGRRGKQAPGGEYQGAMEEFKKIRSDLENQLAGQEDAAAKIGEQWQQETAERKRVEEEYRGAAEEFRGAIELEDQLAGAEAELQRLQEQLQQEMNGRRQVEAEAAKRPRNSKRSGRPGKQLPGGSGELQQVKEQLQREIAERKKAAEALQQSVAQFWTLMDSVEKTLSDLGKDTL